MNIINKIIICVTIMGLADTRDAHCITTSIQVSKNKQLCAWICAGAVTTAAVATLLWYKRAQRKHINTSHSPAPASLQGKIAHNAASQTSPMDTASRTTTASVADDLAQLSADDRAQLQTNIQNIETAKTIGQNEFNSRDEYEQYILKYYNALRTKLNMTTALKLAEGAQDWSWFASVKEQLCRPIA